MPNSQFALEAQLAHPTPNVYSQTQETDPSTLLYRHNHNATVIKWKTNRVIKLKNQTGKIHRRSKTFNIKQRDTS